MSKLLNKAIKSLTKRKEWDFSNQNKVFQQLVKEIVEG